MISKSFIRNDKIRAAADALAAKYPAFAPQVFEKRNLTFHGQDRDGSFKSWTRAEVPLFALTSDLSYWLSVDGAPSATFSRWWDICDIVAGYMVRAAQTGTTYATDADGFVRDLSSCGLDAAMIRAVLGSFQSHVNNIPFGSYLFNPASVLALAGKSSGVSGLMLPLGAAALGLAAFAMRGKKK